MTAPSACTGEADPFDTETVDRLENHNFENIRVLQWRNRDLDFGSLDAPAPKPHILAPAARA